MKHFTRILALVLSIALVGVAGAGQVEIKLKDGSRWRGDVNDVVQIEFMMGGSRVTMEGAVAKVQDLYIQVKGTFAGQSTLKTISKSDIVSMKTTGAATPDADAPEAEAAAPGADANAPAAPVANKNDLGVFVLPLKGTVGETLRHDEIKELAEYIDKNYGPGQIIVLEIESGGGIMIECEKIRNTIVEIRKRHRVVAWIKEAISAAAATAAHCNEIYFRTTGTLGAMTMFNGGTGISVKGEELEEWLQHAGDWFEAGGRSKYIAWAMIDDVKVVSYDKDPVTGEVTWYDNKNGKHVLSDEKTNLVFNASTAVECNFADGIADTNEELAKLLNLPRWNEKSDYGRKIAKEWQDTVEKAKYEIPLLLQQMNYKGAGAGGKARIGKQIEILRDLIRWWDKCPIECLLMGVPPKDFLQEQIDLRKRQLAG